MSVKEKTIQIIKRTCKNLGENNKPTYVVMAIAAVKGICRPAFTMLDKTEDPKTKKYTALREGLTEVIAIPAYWACGELAAKMAKKLFKEEGFVKRAEKNLMFLGVCGAALFVIPALCSVAIKPVMNKLGFNAPTANNTDQTAITTKSQISAMDKKQQVTHEKYPAQRYAYTGRPQIGMRIGGL